MTTTRSERGRRTSHRRLRAMLKWAGTALIVAVLGLALAAHLGAVSVHVVTSSSMQPALRTNDMLIARTVPASSAEVGDIVTLRHPGGHLVTHRVLENEPNFEGPGRLIVMQGDDNEAADPQPYPVEAVDATLMRIPLLGGALQAVARPPASYIAIGSLVLLAIAGLIPRRPSRTQET